MFCNKPTPSHTTAYPTFKEGVNMHTGKRNPLHFPEVETHEALPTQPGVN